MRHENSKSIFGCCALSFVLGCRGGENQSPEVTGTASAPLTTTEENVLITQAWTALGGAPVVGNATAPAASLPNGVGEYQTFANGVIVWSQDDGTVLLPTTIFNFWIGLASVQAVEDPTRTQFDYIGLPRNNSATPPQLDTVPWHAKVNFDRGIIGVTPSNQVFDVMGNIFVRYAANPPKWGLPTGTPAHTSIPSLTFSWIGEAFAGGEIWTRGSPSTTFITVELQAGLTFNDWIATSLYGDPTGDIQSDGHSGDFGMFTGGDIYSSPSTGSFGVPANPTDANGNSLASEYAGLGGPTSWLGYPTAASGTSPAGAVYSSFQSGLLVVYPLGGGAFATPEPFGTLTFSWDFAQDTDSPGCFGFTIPFTSFCVGAAEGPFMQTSVTISPTGRSTPIAGPTGFPPPGSGCTESFVGITLTSQSNVYCDNSQQAIGYTVPIGVAQGASSFTVDFVSEGYSDSLFQSSSSPTFGHLQVVYDIDNQFGQLLSTQQTAPDNASYNFTSHVINAVPFSSTDYKGALWWSFANFDTSTLPYTTYVDTFAGVASESFNGVGSWGDKIFYDLVYQSSAANGNCFGMALDSIDPEFDNRTAYSEPLHQYFEGSISTQNGAPLNASANAAYAALAQEINVKFGYQLGVDMINYILSNFIGSVISPVSTLNAVEIALETNDHPLFAISSDLLLENGHVIRPYQIGPSGVPCQTISTSATCTQIFVLDPNIPLASSSATQFVEFSSDGSWAYNPVMNGSSFYGTESPPVTYAGSALSGGRITYIPYAVLNHQPPTPVAELGEVAIGVALTAIVIFGDTASLNQVTDNAGLQLFTHPLGGAPLTWEDLATGPSRIPNTALIPLYDPAPGSATILATKELQATQVYSVGLAPGHPNGTPYEAMFSSSPLSTDVVVPGTVGVPDQITLNQLATPSKSVAFAVPSSGTSKPITWTVAGPDKSRPIQLSQLLVAPSQQLTAILENGAGRIKIDNAGPATSATISVGNSTSLPVAAGTIQIPAGESGQNCTFTGTAPICMPMALEENSIFGFENASAWTGTGFPLTTVSNPRTQGAFALEVGGTGYRVVTSAAFSTAIFTGLTSKLALDVYVPAGPSNPYYLGAIQLYATSPSANIYNAYEGQVELTGDPSGAFTTITFNLTPQVVAAMSSLHADFSLSIAVNVPPAAQSPVLDNLRFSN